MEKLEGSIEDKDTGKNILQDDGGAEIYKGYTKDGRIVNINPERGIRTKQVFGTVLDGLSEVTILKRKNLMKNMQIRTG